MSPGPRGAARRWQPVLGAWNAIVFGAWLVGPFALAGSARWALGWLHLGLLAAALSAHAWYVRRRNPALREARRRSGPGTPAWDLAWNALFWPAMAAPALLAGRDQALHGPSLPPVAWPAGAALLLCGLSLSARAMAVNPYFEGTVRIQAERDQRVVEAGPYRWLRHPGYLGLCGWALATPLLLRSAWALAASAGPVAWLVLRTALEDAALRRALPGYLDYARRVRFRLLPGIW
jgi:protein-S-isoprenylcysteine O-methyltransferase Ste14